MIADPRMELLPWWRLHQSWGRQKFPMQVLLWWSGPWSGAGFGFGQNFQSSRDRISVEASGQLEACGRSGLGELAQ